ncbi:MAG: amidase [Burkholderiales bacterium]
MHDLLGAFVPGTSVSIQGATTGPLAGMSFAAKDLFDVAGTVTGSGNPDWARTHAPAERSAWAVERLLQSGATLAGKTITDEISLGLLGINRFHGTPVNPRAPNLVPGGSSSGSAAAVAGGLVDTALGTDSGGSVRTPASFTGLYGLRPTHGRISTQGMATQSPSFDTAGFFARDPTTFARVGSALLDAPIAGVLPEEILIATDCFNDADLCVRDTLQQALPRLQDVMNRGREIELATEGIDYWAAQQRLLQSFEFGRTFRDWILINNPCFSFEVASALVNAAQISEEDIAGPRLFRTEVRARIDGLLEDRRVICLPTAPILPIRREARLNEMQEAVSRIIRLTCIAGLAGLPQVTLPLGSCAGVPVGLSLIGWRGSDMTLLAIATAIRTRTSA